MEFGTIEREIHVEATPEVVFEVITKPEHLREWWPDDATLEAVPGGAGELIWGEGGTQHPMVVPITVVDAVPGKLFSFRWVAPEGEVPGPANSLLVTFELVPQGAGTVVRLTESGFRERGWEAAVLEAAYNEHVTGWDLFVPRLGVYIARLVSTP
ncbi:MAG TPA: SRPBCC domain-containing protein [Nocardioidaceae bacterium]|nr:SRPBCC domain-containing protein [Nocardioidaceae bacterium]